MPQPMRCPSCAMTAERHDRRQWIPLVSEVDEWRRCRNCGSEVDLGVLVPCRVA